MRSEVEQSPSSDIKIAHQSEEHPSGLYTTKAIFYNSHYGKIIKNVTKNIKIDFTIKSEELMNMELDCDHPDHNNEVKTTLLPG